MYVSVSVIIGSVHWAHGQFTLDEIQCHTREITYKKVHGYFEIAIVYGNLGKCNGIFTTNLHPGILRLGILSHWGRRGGAEGKFSKI